MVFDHTRALTASSAVVWLLAAHAAVAGEVRLSWLPIPGSEGYVVYWRQIAEPYGEGVDVGNILADGGGVVRYVVNDVPLDVPHYFAVTSYSQGVESGFSNELALKPPLLCAAAPLADCRAPMVPRAAILSIRNPSGVSRDRLRWKWAGADSEALDFGDPSRDTSYVLCIYDESRGVPNLAMSIDVRAGGVCGNARPCWRDLGRRGFTYVNRSVGGRGSSLKMKLKHRGDGASIQLSGAGESFTLPDPVGGSFFQQEPAVVVQLVNDALPSVCWEAAYSAAARVNTSTRFKDASD